MGISLVRFTCSRCKATFENVQALKAHAATHNGSETRGLTRLKSQPALLGDGFAGHREPHACVLEANETRHRLVPKISIALITVALGALVMSLANAFHRDGTAGAYALFWAGLAVMFAPVMWRVVDPRASRNERLLLILALGVALYVSKVAFTSTAFDFSDEFAHDRATANLLLTGHLFALDPLLKAAAYYPGLAVVTSALVKLSGLSVYVCGTIVIGVAKFTMATALFLLLERLTASSRAAGLGVLVYVANPNFLYWSAQFAYESLALPLAMVALYLLVRRAARARDGALTSAAIAVVAAVVLTHHMTAYALSAVLVVWSCLAWIERHRTGDHEYAPIVPAVAAVLASVSWLVFVAPVTFAYLGPVFDRAATQGIELLTRRRTSRALFGTVSAPPLWERIAAMASVLTVFVLLPFGLREVTRRPILLLGRILAWSSVFWIALLPLRLTQFGQETANRSSEFLYLGIGLALGVLLSLPVFTTRRVRRVLAAVLVGIMLAGGFSVSWNHKIRLAPQYSSAGIPLWTTPDERAAASWFLAHYGPNRRIATDLLTNSVFGSVGMQRVITTFVDDADIWRIFYPTSITPGVIAEVRARHVEYIVVQRRLSEGETPGWPLYDSGDPAAFYSRPIPRQSLVKFAMSPLFQLVYQSGEVDIYAVSPALTAGNP